MADVDGDLKIGARIDTSNVKKDLSSFGNSVREVFRKISEGGKNASSSMLSLQNQIQKTTYELEKAKKAQYEIGKQELPTKQYTNLQNEIKKTEQLEENLVKKRAEYSVMSKRMGMSWDDIKQSTTYQKLSTQIDMARDRVKGLRDDLNKLRADEQHKAVKGIDTQQYADASQKVSYLTNKLEQLNARASEVGTSSNKGANLFKKAFGGLKNVLGGIKNKFKDLKKNSNNTFGEMAKNAKISFMKILKYAFGIRSIYALFRRLRKYTKEAFEAMSASVPQVREELNSLKISLTQAKNSLATAFQPIFSYIVPALNALCSALAAAMNALANFFATFTGQKFIYKATKANNALADSIGGAGAAAKDANEDIAEYDKLIVINKDKADGGGGGGGGADANAGAFEQVPSEVNKFAQMIKDAWKKADFTDVGKYIGESLKSALDNINWDKIKKSAKKIAKSFATLLDGFFSVPDLFKSIGKTIGEGINTAIEFASTFVETMTKRKTWEKVGKQVGEGLTELFKTIDTVKLGKTIAGAINGAIKTVHTFITTTDWKLIATKLADGFNSLLDIFDANELGKTIHDAIASALDFVSTLLTKTDFTKIGRKISDLLGSLDIPDLVNKLLKLARNIINSLAEALSNVDWAEVGKAIGETLSTIADNIPDLLGALANLAMEILKGIGEAILNAAAENPITTAIATVIGGIVLTGGRGGLLGKAVGALGGKILTGIGVGIKALGGKLFGPLKTAIIDYVNWNGIGALVGNIFKITGVIGAAVGAAILGWNLGEKYLSPAVEAGLTYLSEKYGDLGEQRDKQASQERFQEIAQIQKHIAAANVEIKKYGTNSAEASKLATQAYQDIEKEIETVYDGEYKWRQQTAKLSAKARLGLITEKEKLEELQKIYETTDNRFEKIIAGAGLGLGKFNETVTDTKETAIETSKELGKAAQDSANHYEKMYKTTVDTSKKATESAAKHYQEMYGKTVSNSVQKVQTATIDLGKEAQDTAKHYTDMYKKSIIAPSKKAAKSINNVNKSTKNLDKTTKKTAKDTEKAWDNSNTSIEKNSKSTFSKIIKSFTDVKTSMVKDSAIASTKTITNLNNVSKKVKTTGLTTAFKSAFTQISTDAETESGKAIDSLDSINKLEMVVQNIDFSKMQEDIKNNEGPIKTALAECLKIPNATESLDAFTKALNDLPGLSTSSKEALIADFQAIRVEADNVATSKEAGKEGIKTLFNKAGDAISTRYTSLKDGICKWFEKIKESAETNATGDKGVSHWFNSAGDSVSTRYTKLKSGLGILFEKIKEAARDNAMGSDGTGKTKGLAKWFNMAGDSISDRYTSLKSGVGKLFENMKKLAETFAPGIEKAFTGAADNISKKYNGLSLFSGLNTSAYNSANYIQGVFDTAAGNIQTSLTTAIRNVASALGQINATVKVTSSSSNVNYKDFNQNEGGTRKTLPNPTAYGAASGAVIPPNKEFLAILGDQKQGLNIETPLATMIEAFNTALKQNGGASNNQPIVLQLDGKTVAQVVWDENQRRYKQTGNYKFA